ncbi:hypothetical protein ACA135_04225 [Methanobrevibacter acididurans]|uniref:hypothetical protein n=1 Tax=Methanobrevibacter acididurans TaxID=120963 RepID=UPI0038FC7B1D
MKDFESKISGIRKDLKPELLDKVEASDNRVLIFKKVDFKDEDFDYYYPINNNAYSYLRLKYEEYKKNELYTIEYSIFDNDEKANLIYQLNLIGVMLDKIKLKKKGVIKVDEKIAIYFNTANEPTPINEKSEEIQDQLTNLVTRLPEVTFNVWKKLDTGIEKYL